MNDTDAGRVAALTKTGRGMWPIYILTIGIAAVAPRQWRRWLGLCFAALLLFVLSLDRLGDPQSDDPAVYGASGYRLTTASWVIAVTFAVVISLYTVHAVKASIRQRREGYLPGEMSAAQAIAHAVREHKPVVPQTPSALAQRLAAPPAPAQDERSVIDRLPTPQRRLRVFEDHDTFVVRDYRRFSDALED